MRRNLLVHEVAGQEVVDRELLMRDLEQGLEKAAEVTCCFKSNTCAHY